MAISGEQLDEVVLAWKTYAEESPRKISPKDLLVKRDLAMYRGLGIENGTELADRLVADRSAATIEMTMGYLYERVLEKLGPRKVTNQEKRGPGLKGIDFVQITPSQLRLINLKAGLSTANSDISESTKRNLTAAAAFMNTHRNADDNPLQQQVRSVVMVRAVARGPSRDEVTDEGIRWLVGASLWAYFGAGRGLLARLGEALGRRTLDYGRYQREMQRASSRVLRYMRGEQIVLADGTIRWSELAARFP